MRTLLGCLLVFTLALLCAPNHGFAQALSRPGFYIAPDGSDNNPGTLEKPFATLTGARNALRVAKGKPGQETSITVFIRAGDYTLDKPFILEPQDSGTPQLQIVYQAYQKETPTFSGGQKITGWAVQDGRWTVTLPDVASGQWRFSQLFVDGVRAPRPRLPESGYYYIQSALPPTPANAKKGFDGFQFRPGDINPDWHNLSDVEVIAFHLWSASRFKPALVDPKTSTIRFTGHTPGTDDWTRMPYNHRYLVENVKEALTKPGQWYLDNKTGQLTYLPLPGQTPQNTTIIAPRLTQLVEFQADPSAGKLVQHITLSGLHFQHANWAIPATGQSTPQAETNLSAAIVGTGMQNCIIQNCSISHTGQYALWLAKGSKNNAIQNCQFTDLGAGGIKIGEMDLFENDNLVASHNTVYNCLIAHAGRIHSAGVGVWIGQSHSNKILNNDILDLYYTGISPGWSWGYGKSLSHHNQIAFNHIRQIGQGVLSDMGGVYTLGAGQGNHISYNLIHDISSYSYGGWGIYFDEGTSNLLAENNIVYNTTSAGFHQHYGEKNTLRNNIFAFGTEAQLMRTRPEPNRQTLDIQHNIFLSKNTPLFAGNWTGTNFTLDHNIYFRTDNKPVTFPGNLSLEKWQAKGQDKNSATADPGFVDAEHYNFTLKPDALALKMGFAPINTSLMGRQPTSPFEHPAPYTTTVPRAFPPFEHPPGREVNETFESTPVGDKTSSAKTIEDSQEGTARVTAETAGQGKHSLKFTDSKSNKAEYNPHVYFEPHFKTGTLTGSFLIRPEPGAIIRHEWRDHTVYYIPGPSLLISPDGSLSAGNTPITKLPLSAWSKIQITCTLGSGQYTLIVTPSNGAPITKTLTCSKDFTSLDWLGFTSHATTDTTFYIDEISLK